MNSLTATPWRRTSSSSGLRRGSLLGAVQRLTQCSEAWCPGPPWDRDGAHAALWGRPQGSFLVVRESESSAPSLLCVSTGGENGSVADYHIQHTDAVFQLSGSRLSFLEVAQLVFFYTFTRDVLAVRLSMPAWIYNQTQLDSAVGPKSWLCLSPDLKTDHMSDSDPSTVMCSIQLTSANGALCIINPLYLHEHGDDWLTHQPTSPKRASQPANFKRERRLSTTRPWGGAGLLSKRAISLDQEKTVQSTEKFDLSRAQSVQFSPAPPPQTPPSTPAEGMVVLRRPSRDASSSNPPQRPPSQPNFSPVGPPAPRAGPGPLTPAPRPSSPLPQSPHRVSWIEDGVWLPPPRLPLLLRPPSLELDSLSVSSMEEEQEAPAVTSPAHYHPSAHRLANKVMHRLSAVGQAIGGLVYQPKRLANRVMELSERRGGSFSEAVRGFVEHTLRGGVDPGGVTGSEFLQEVRSSLTGLREILLDCPEITAILDTMTDTPDWEIDAMVERALHKVSLKPVSAHLFSSLQASRCHDGSLPALRGNQRVLESRGVEELGGSVGAGVPDPATVERILQRWGSMHRAYSPSKMAQILLKVCKIIYHSMSSNAGPGAVFGADDFLPCLTWVVVRSDVGTLQLDTDYMMELLDPAQLQGESGYYLTSLYASLFYVSSFRPRLAVRQLSVEAQQSLDQWHRRRTLHCDQSRRSQRRRTIRRPKDTANKEAGSEVGSDAEPAELEGLGTVKEEGQSQAPILSRHDPPLRQGETLLEEEDDGHRDQEKTGKEEGETSGRTAEKGLGS
ncbi:ras and Rab interactor 2 [Aplochiton taeniatus]